jgi:succinate dehydrogenase/fumarate reductase flavoprotein subunit
LRGRTIEDLAKAAGIDPAGLASTVADYNEFARRGEDPAFGRGSNALNRYLGDPDNKPNPNVAPIETGPFYAVKVVTGDLGTFAGLRADENSQVVDGRGVPIPGLFVAGNDAASIMGGNYVGGGNTLGPALTFGYAVGRHLAAVGDKDGATSRAA